MACFLMKYKGIYRVLPNTNGKPVPRDENGNIDKTFDDIYIKCAKNCQIYFYGNGTSNRHKLLEFYSPSISYGRNTLKDIYVTYVNKVDISKLPYDKQIKIDDTMSVVKTKKAIARNGKEIDVDSISYKCNIQDVYDQLIKKGIFTDIYESDTEVFARFDDKLLENKSFEKYFNPSISGADISPFSTKNIKKNEYKIPESDNKKYNYLLTKLDITKESGKLINIVHINRKFDDYIVNKLSNKRNTYDIKSEKTKANLGVKEFIHSIGMWEDYLKFLEKELKEV